MALRGRVKSMYVEGDSLIMTCELIGEDAIAAAGRNDVSIHSPPEFTDGKGNKYQQPITHVALTPEPLVPGLGEFISIAASRRLEFRTMNLKGLAKLLGVEGDVDPASAEGKFTTAIKKLQSDLAAANKKLGTVKASHDDEPNPKDKDKDKDKDKGKSKDKEPAPLAVSLMVLSLARENRTLRLDKLLESGRIDKAAHAKLIETFATDGPLTLALSANTKDADGFDRVYDILKDNKPVSLGEHTGLQDTGTITMADGTKRNSEDVLVIDAERRAKAAAV